MWRVPLSAQSPARTSHAGGSSEHLWNEWMQAADTRVLADEACGWSAGPAPVEKQLRRSQRVAGGPAAAAFCRGRSTSRGREAIQSILCPPELQTDTQTHPPSSLGSTLAAFLFPVTGRWEPLPPPGWTLSTESQVFSYPCLVQQKAGQEVFRSVSPLWCLLCCSPRARW